MIWANCKSAVAGSILFSGDLKWEGDLSSIEDRRVQLFVHGFKNTRAQLEKFYGEMHTRSGSMYDEAIGFAWPSGATPFAWPVVRTASLGPAAEALHTALRNIRAANPRSIDIVAHSLGCILTMEALDCKVDNIFLMAPAMTRSLAKYRDRVEAHASNVYVLRSKRDAVLSLSMLWWPYRRALGQFGESTPGGRVAVDVDCTKEVGADHNGYRQSSLVYQTFANAQQRSQ